MLPPEDKAAYDRLGRLLRQRRIDLDLKYRTRTRFREERAAGINERMLQDIENGSRGGYSADNKRAIEGAYELAPGSLDRTLAGGDIEPLGFTAKDEDIIARFRAFLEWERAQKERSA